MTRSYTKMPTPEGAAAGQTATCRLPLGYTYNRLFIDMNAGGTPTRVAEANWGSNINGIRLKVDGDTKIEATAADLVSLNKYNGHTHDAGILPIFLNRHWMRTIQGEDQTGYDTAGGMSSFTLEMDLASGITLNDLSVYAEQSDPRDPQSGQVRQFGPHYRLQKYTHNQGVTGEAQITDIVKGTYSVFAMHLKTANISDLEIRTNEKTFYDLSAEMRAQISKLGGRVPQSGFTHVDLAATNRLADALPMTWRDFRIVAQFTGTGSVPIYVESIQGRSLLAS